MTNSNMTLEPYQSKAVTWLSTTRRGIVVASAGSGKTVIMAAALDTVAKLKPRSEKIKAGWLCHTLEQKEQAIKALTMFPDLERLMEFRVECAASEKTWGDCAVLVVDEVHWAGCEQWSKQVLSCPGARWGCTATPFVEDPERNRLLLEMFGNQMLKIDRAEVSNRLAPAKVIMLDATDPGLQQPIDDEIKRTMAWRIKYWKGEEWKLKAIVSWQVCIKLGIINNAARNAAAVTLAKRHAADSVLVLVNEIEHGQALCDAIPGSALCYSKMGKKARRETLEEFKSGTIRCIIGTSLLDEGFDAPIANVLILVSGGRSSAKSEQRTGRVLRVFAGKERGLIYDFNDRQHTMMANHAKKRMATYRKLGYEIDAGQTQGLW
jgi:superfamily II DNA or RNA helicase